MDIFDRIEQCHMCGYLRYILSYKNVRLFETIGAIPCVWIFDTIGQCHIMCYYLRYDLSYKICESIFDTI